MRAERKRVLYRKPGGTIQTAASTARTSAARAAERLLRWASKSGRQFPWRVGNDPYAVLIAEKLLQQTAAREIVVRAYCKLLQAYPTPESLACADVEVLEEIVRPLGLSYRAKELHALGRALTQAHHGQVPSTMKDLLLLPGVGEYAARAVLSFAFKEDVPIVDTNVARFLHRFFGIVVPLPANPARNRGLVKLAETLVPKGRSKEFNLAVLDLCAAICKPKRPLCEACPVRSFCIYGSSQSFGNFETAR